MRSMCVAGSARSSGLCRYYIGGRRKERSMLLFNSYKYIQTKLLTPLDLAITSSPLSYSHHLIYASVSFYVFLEYHMLVVVHNYVFKFWSTNISTWLE
jgi:hypothetical protein